MISFDQFKKVMSFDTCGRFCIEILFAVKGSERFDGCWMGKRADEKKKIDFFWFGLTPDGQNAYEYSSFDAFSTARVFDGKSLFEIWETVTVLEIDGCDPTDRILAYVGEENG